MNIWADHEFGTLSRDDVTAIGDRPTDKTFNPFAKSTSVKMRCLKPP
jgi:hypothetical protein